MTPVAYEFASKTIFLPKGNYFCIGVGKVGMIVADSALTSGVFGREVRSIKNPIGTQTGKQLAKTPGNGLGRQMGEKRVSYGEVGNHTEATELEVIIDQQPWLPTDGQIGTEFLLQASSQQLRFLFDTKVIAGSQVRDCPRTESQAAAGDIQED
jgi:hypothetical protein